ncbi:Polyadenylate-binding protein-interacting protein 12 [Hibiscus syriacus]|uniref:Polyadenylate-binding protein-interacting protein 12 n=1 Tax=Hibiscus syriacus TaxID=106335 RepID=A0A6A2WV02_HIBSY|nr:Polyadenylate-binding protein-interacting protein 12 [Hibiscus syriacus]
MAVVENVSNQDAVAASAVAMNDQDQSKQNHVRSKIDPSLHQNDQGLYNKIGGPHPRSKGGDLQGSNGGVGDEVGDSFKRDMRELQELFSKLNPMAEEFVPHSVANHGINGGLFTNNSFLQNNSIPRNVNGAGGRKKVFIQGKRRLNTRTSMAQREAIIRRTVYVSDIDQQVTEEQLAGLFVNCGQVVDCRICGDPNSVLRFAFVEFTDEEGAQAALSLAGTMLGFYPVEVLPSKTAIAPVNPTFLPRVTQDDVRLFFETFCGEVYRLRLLGDYNHSTRIAFVEFVMAESAIAALNCSGVVLGSLPIRVSPSKTPVREKCPLGKVRFGVQTKVNGWLGNNEEELDRGDGAIASFGDGCFSVKSCMRLMLDRLEDNSLWSKCVARGCFSSSGVLSVGDIGGLLWDEKGVMLDSLSEKVGSSPPILAELLAIKRGLRLFLDSEWASRGRLILKSDCLVALDWINNPTSCTLLFKAVMNDIANIVLNRGVVIRHIMRCKLQGR